MFSVIVFSERCTLKSINLSKSSPVKVINRYSVYQTVKEIYDNNQNLFTEEGIEKIYDKIYACSQVEQEIKLKHIENIQKNLDISSTPIMNAQRNDDKVINHTTEEELCPKCGGKMVKRIANRGKNRGKEFYGCENFPKCKYIK